MADSDLTVRSESIQRLYNLYLSDRFLVNRRYQRKLVWTVEEKQRLVDSVLKDLPIPLFLVAETTTDGGLTYELIDGLQRLNAVFSYLENEYPVGDTYFDLDALADTKLGKDSNELTQQELIRSRESSIKLANYVVALSVFRAPNDEAVDEVFRRINGGGRQLSRHSLRQAGTLSSLADAVRVISSQIRGDTSPSDLVPLQLMPKLSITNYSLPYGVDVDSIFWVREGVLRRDEVRESADEQLVLDILLDILVEPLPTSGTRIRDAYYNFADDSEGLEISKESKAVTLAIEAYGSVKLADNVTRTYDEIRGVLAEQSRKFPALIGAGSGGRSPRYYHAIFLAFYELIFKERLRIRDYGAAAAALSGVGTSIMAIPGGGGDWGSASKRTTVDALKGVLRSSFEGPISGNDLGRYGYASQLETLLSNALIEQQQFDHKQGLYNLANSRAFDESCFSKICRTLTAMANAGPGVMGYILLGVADTEADADRIATLDDIKPYLYRGFRIVGIDREAKIERTDLNDYWHWIGQKITTSSLDPMLAAQVAANARVIPYQGMALGLLRVSGGSQPYFFDGELVERVGSETKTVPQSDYMRVFALFAG